MICLNCGNEMFIDEWNRWIWACPVCDYEGREATKEEIKELENKDGYHN